MKIRKNFITKKSILVLAVILSALLYMAGVFSGLYANKIIKEQTEKDITNLKFETKEDLSDLENYVNFLDINLKNMQLEQAFMETLSHEEMCDYSVISFNELIEQLKYYWEKLPFRIEGYERNNYLSEEYLNLKQQYTHLSIRTWLLAKNQYEKCNISVVHGLYFYSADCTECVKQGEELDELSRKVKASGKEIIMFPIDYNSKEPIIKNLKGHYSINSTPAVMINSIVYQSRIYNHQELLNSIN